MAVTDAQVRKLMTELEKHGELGKAAMRSGMDRKTARKFRDAGKLPSELKTPRTWRTRDDPFDEDWAYVRERLAQAPELARAQESVARHPHLEPRLAHSQLPAGVAHWDPALRLPAGECDQLLGERRPFRCRASRESCRTSDATLLSLQSTADSWEDVKLTPIRDAERRAQTTRDSSCDTNQQIYAHLR